MATSDRSERGDVNALDRILPALAGLGYKALVYGAMAFLLAPLVVVVMLSFRPEAYGRTILTSGWPSTTWYESLPSLFQYLKIGDAIFASVTLALTTTVVSVVVGGMAAFAIVRYDFTFSTTLETVLISPLVYPWLLMAIGILMVISEVSQTLGVRISLSFWTLLAGHVLFTFPYAIRTIGASLQNYNARLDEASRNLGGTRLDTLVYVTLPLIRPGVLSGAVLVFILSFNQYIISLFLSGADTQTVPLLMFNLIWTANPPELATVGVLFMLGTMTLVMITEYVAGLSEYL
jgi:ABC-type spermidine/putrescine transport system permease subunit II